MARQNNDNPAVPQGRRKVVPIQGSDMVRGGGKGIADDEQECQLDLFGGTAARGRAMPAESVTKGNRSTRRAKKERKSPKKGGIGTPATMEQVVELLDQALRNVVANHGSAGPNRQ